MIIGRITAIFDINKRVPGSLVFGIHTAIHGGLCVVGGDLPVVVDGECISDIGINSGTPQQVIQCAQASIDFFLKSVEK